MGRTVVVRWQPAERVGAQRALGGGRLLLLVVVVLLLLQLVLLLGVMVGGHQVVLFGVPRVLQGVRAADDGRTLE